MLKHLKVVLLVGLAFFALGSPFANAITVKEVLAFKPKKLEDHVPSSLNERLYKRLAKAQQLMADNKLDSALEMLNGLVKSSRNQPYAAAQVYQTLGYTYAQKDNFKEAAKYFALCLKEDALPLAPTLNTMFSLAQVLVAQEKFLEAIPHVRTYLFNQEEKNPDAHFFLAQLYSQIDQKALGAAEVEKAIKLVPQPKENWLRLLGALYYELKKFSKAADALAQLVEINPSKKEYWKQLSSVYITANKDERALATLEVAHKKGFLVEEKEIYQLVQLSIFRGVPYKAARYLEEGLKEGKVAKTKKNYELLADAWIQAQELDQALDALSKAAPLAKDGAVYVRQGQLYLEKEEWKKSMAALKAGISKGGLKKPGVAYVSLGISQFKLGDVDGSIRSFQKAQGYPQQKRQATEWINHLTSGATTH